MKLVDMKPGTGTSYLEVIFETDDDCTYFLCVLHVNPEFSVQVSNQVSNQEESILEYCLTPRTRSEIFLKIGISNKHSIGG